MKTIEIEYELLKYFDFRKNIIVTNVTPLSSLVAFEVDMLILSKSRYATGVEIKITKQDLRNDLKKKHIATFNKPQARKHYFKKLKYFYYAVPKELEKEAIKQIPKAFGLIIIDEKITIVQKPSLLSNTKWDERSVLKLYRIGMMRIYRLTKAITKMIEK